MAQDIFVSNSIWSTGTYEPIVSLILKELFLLWSNEGDKKPILLDVGANLGIHGLYIAKLGYRVWAVEPQERNLIKVFKIVFNVILKKSCNSKRNYQVVLWGITYL